MSNRPKVNTISSDDRLWAALTYIFSPLIPIILLVLDDYKNRSYIRYHSIQALVVGIVLSVLVPIIAILTAGCGVILWLIMFYWAYKAYQGEWVEIPIVTNFVKNQDWV
jgi:uncharacterized membrane protein